MPKCMQFQVPFVDEYIPAECVNPAEADLKPVFAHLSDAMQAQLVCHAD